MWALLAALALLPLTLPELGSLNTAREIKPVVFVDRAVAAAAFNVHRFVVVRA